MAPHLHTYTALICAFVTYVASIQPRPQPKPAFTDFNLHYHTAACSCSLPFKWALMSVIHVITWNTTRLPNPEQWKAELAQLADP